MEHSNRRDGIRRYKYEKTILTVIVSPANCRVQRRASDARALSHARSDVDHARTSAAIRANSDAHCCAADLAAPLTDGNRRTASQRHPYRNVGDPGHRTTRLP